MRVRCRTNCSMISRVERRVFDELGRSPHDELRITSERESRGRRRGERGRGLESNGECRRDFPSPGDLLGEYDERRSGISVPGRTSKRSFASVRSLPLLFLLLPLGLVGFFEGESFRWNSPPAPAVEDFECRRVSKCPSGDVCSSSQGSLP